MKLSIDLATVLICTIFVGVATAAPTGAVTLDRRGAIRMALAQNPRVAAARAEEAVLVAQRRQVDAARFPIVALDAGIGPSLKATLVPGTAVQSAQRGYGDLKAADLSAVFLANLTVAQPLYTFGKIALRQEATDHGLRARQAQTRMERADVAFEVAQLYEGYLLARDAGRFLNEILHWLQSTEDATAAKLVDGVANVSDREVLRLNAAGGLARMGLAQAQAGQAQAEAGLVAYLGLPLGQTIVAIEPELEPVGRLPDRFAELAGLAADHRPEFTALREGRQAIAALARAEAAGLAPDIFLLGLLSAAFTPGRDWLETRFVVDPLNHVVPGLLLGLRWQFQGDTAAARADEQRGHADALHHTERWATAGIPAEVRRYQEDVLRANHDIEVGLETVRKAKQWMVTAGADYGVGLGDVREVSDAVAAYVTLRTAVLKARFDHNVAMAALAKATGTLDREDPVFYLAAPNEPVRQEPKP